MRRGQLTSARQMWKHLRRYWRKNFWGRERAAERRQLATNGRGSSVFGGHE